jgi:Icc-related predicted phosphoesterase
MPQWFFTSDLHGQMGLYEQVLAEAAAGRPSALIIGGDLGPHAEGAPGVRHQRLFLEGFFVEFARRLRDAVPGVQLLLLMGNDDWAVNHDVLEREDGQLWRVLHERVLEVDGVPVAGLSWVPITPFRIKDWERWEDGEPESPLRLAGFRSGSGGVHEHVFDPQARTPTIAEALAALAARTTPGETTFVLHSPPRGTACDVMAGGAHVGSRAIRAFVERHQPRLTLSGHIHESPRVTGAWHDRIGDSVCVNPGQFGSPRVCGVWFDPVAPGTSLRHTVHGTGRAGP